MGYQKHRFSYDVRPFLASFWGILTPVSTPILGPSAPSSVHKVYRATAFGRSGIISLLGCFAPQPPPLLFAPFGPYGPKNGGSLWGKFLGLTADSDPIFLEKVGGKGLFWPFWPIFGLFWSILGSFFGFLEFLAKIPSSHRGQLFFTFFIFFGPQKWGWERPNPPAEKGGKMCKSGLRCTLFTFLAFNLGVFSYLLRHFSKVHFDVQKWPAVQDFGVKLGLFSEGGGDGVKKGSKLDCAS